MRQLNSEELGNVDGGITLGGFGQGVQAQVANPTTTTGITFNGAGPFPFAGGGPFPFDGFHHHGGFFADPAAREAVTQFLNDPAFESAVTSFTAAHPEYADQLNHVVDFLEHRADGTFPFNGQGHGFGFPFNGNGFPFNGNGFPFNGIPFQGLPNGVPVIGQPLAGTPPTLDFNNLNGANGNGTFTVNPNGNGYTYTYTYTTDKP